MKLFLLRHGQSIGNTKSGYISGRCDSEGLTYKGKMQTIRTAYELRKEEISKIFVSPVVRTQETAKLLSRYFPNAKLEVCEWLTELHHGVLEGSYWWEVIHKIPSEWRKLREGYDISYPGGGESMGAMYQRVSTGLTSLIGSLDSDAKIAIISHQAPTTAMEYFFKFGCKTDIQSKTEQQKHIKYIHENKMSNGGILKVILKGKTAQKIEKISKFKQVLVNKKNVEFYIKGILDSDNLLINRIITASKNVDYHIKNGGDHLLKIFNQDSSKMAQRHSQIYGFLSKKNIPVPKITFYDNSQVFYKPDVVVQDFAIGTEQSSCLIKHQKLALNNLELVYLNIDKVHNIDPVEVAEFWFSPAPKQFQNYKPFMLFNINMTLHIVGDSLLKQTTVDKLFKDLSKLKDYIKHGGCKLVPIHGDLAPGNLIFSHKNNKCTFERIIDFEWNRIGDRFWDLAYYWGWLERDDKKAAKKWHDVLKKYIDHKSLKIIELYRVLFHSWTVRDMYEYPKEKLRQERGEKSRNILERE